MASLLRPSMFYNVEESRAWQQATSDAGVSRPAGGMHDVTSLLLTYPNMPQTRLTLYRRSSPSVLPPPSPPPLLPSSIHLSIAPPFLSLLSSRDAPRATRRFSTHVRHAHAYVRERVARAPYERAMGARLPLCERWPKRHALVMVPLEFQI